MPEEKKLISGTFERIGIGESFYTLSINQQKIKKTVDIKDHKEALNLLIEELVKNQIVNDLQEIKAIGHRVVHGGEVFKNSVIITDEVINKMEELSSLAPLHNPPAITGIKSAKTVIPNAIQVAVFDTSFHQTMAKETFLYAVPLKWYEKYQVRKYGMHGTSHKYIAEKMNHLYPEKNKLIICHIGSGASISAVENGKCVDTSMGFTPNAGLIMGTRSGDIDASMLSYMIEKEKISLAEIETILNKQSGLLGICGKSDMRDICDQIKNNDEKSILAFQMFIERVVDYIAKYYFKLQGCDAIVFTAGIGENSAIARKEILKRLEFLDIKLDEEQNEKIAGFKDQNEGKISANDSKIPVYVIPTDEEIMIARDTFHFAA